MKWQISTSSRLEEAKCEGTRVRGCGTGNRRDVQYYGVVQRIVCFKRSAQLFEFRGFWDFFFFSFPLEFCLSFLDKPTRFLNCQVAQQQTPIISPMPHQNLVSFKGRLKGNPVWKAQCLSSKPILVRKVGPLPLIGGNISSVRVRRTS